MLLQTHFLINTSDRKKLKVYVKKKRRKYLVDKLFMVCSVNRELFKFPNVKLLTTKLSVEGMVYFQTDILYLHMYVFHPLKRYTFIRML